MRNAFSLIFLFVHIISYFVKAIHIKIKAEKGLLYIFLYHPNMFKAITYFRFGGGAVRHRANGLFLHRLTTTWEPVRPWKQIQIPRKQIQIPGKQIQIPGIQIQILGKQMQIQRQKYNTAETNTNACEKKT